MKRVRPPHHAHHLPLPVALAFAAALVATPARARAQQKDTTDVQGLVVRTRVIGVFDSETGKPIDSAEVKDIFTHLSAITTPTGTVALPMDTAGAFLRVRKIGYNMNTFLIPNGKADTLPITLTLDRVGQMLPTMVTNAHGVAKGPADTVMKLDMTGFYARRLQGAAPPTAYMSEAQIDHWAPTQMTDLASLSGRPWMWECKIYIDGALTPIPPASPAPGSVSRALGGGINAMLDPSMVAGVEVYRAGEAPAQYNATLASPSGGSTMQTGGTHDGCVTLIWTR